MPFISGQTAAGKSRLVWNIINDKSKDYNVIFFPLSFSRQTSVPVFCPAPISKNLANGMYAGNLTETFVTTHLRALLAVINQKFLLDCRYFEVADFVEHLSKYEADVATFNPVFENFTMQDDSYFSFQAISIRLKTAGVSLSSFLKFFARSLTAFFVNRNIGYRLQYEDNCFSIIAIANNYVLRLYKVIDESVIPDEKPFYFIFDSLDNLINISSKYAALGTGGEQLAPLELALLFHNNLCLSNGHRCLVTFNLSASTLPRTFKLMQYFVYLGAGLTTDGHVYRYLLVVNPYSRSQSYFRKYVAYDFSSDAVNSVYEAVYSDFCKFEQYFYKPNPEFNLEQTFQAESCDTQNMIEVIEKAALINLPSTTVDIVKRTVVNEREKISQLEGIKLPTIADINDDISTSMLKQTLDSLQKKQEQLNKIAITADKTKGLAIAAKNRDISAQIRDIEYKLNPSVRTL